MDKDYDQTPLTALKTTSRKKVAQYLNLDGTLCVIGDMEVINNYYGLAELVGFSYVEIKNFETQKNPTEELLNVWITKDYLVPTVGSLLKYLRMMERVDIITDCQKCIFTDVQASYEEMEEKDFAIQVEKVTHPDLIVDETAYVSVDDVKNPGELKQQYHAFVCYNPERKDLKFVKNMILELEGPRHNLKLFVPGRDDLPGSSDHVISAYLIEKRCRRVVIIMSLAFQKSSACEFQMKFAHALAPGARSKKLIPIILDEDLNMPRILRFITPCDFTNVDTQDWVWNRLASSIRAPIKYTSQELKCNDTEKLKDINLDNTDACERWNDSTGKTLFPPNKSVTSSSSSNNVSSDFTDSDQRKTTQPETYMPGTTTDYSDPQPSAVSEPGDCTIGDTPYTKIKRKSNIKTLIGKLRKPGGSSSKKN